MKIDIFEKPPPLEFGKGDDSFKLVVTSYTSIQRAAVMDAVADRSFHSMMASVEPLVVGWENVCDKGGQPIPFETTEDGHQIKRNLGLFIGKLPLMKQMHVMLALLCFVDIPFDDIQAWMKGAGLKREDLDPILRQDGNGPTGASED